MRACIDCKEQFEGRWGASRCKRCARERTRFTLSVNHKVHAAMRRGELVRQPCETCGTTKGVQAHHDDYSKPLDVRWLCRLHHRQVDVALRRQHREQGANA